MGRILTGTASWTDQTLLDSGWYPTGADSAEDRLKYYTTRFPLVEVDSTFYGLPSERTAVLWSDRTPDAFTFDFKAFRLFTGHPTPLSALPKAVRAELPSGLSEKRNVYAKDMPPELTEHVWTMYRSALMPVHSAGKLGAVFLQFPKWFFFGKDNLRYIEQARQHLPDFRIAVEFRQPGWLSDKHATETLDFLKQNHIAYTCVDEPQGTAASVPPIAAATTDFSVVRFHGRREDTWDKPRVGVEERFKYLYSDAELEEWVPKIEALSRETREVHVLMNNCYADYGVRNAQQLGSLLLQTGAQVVAAD